ncbi:hypothetical protein DPSP01_004254 [Paraphaeosphaeria sporulosa]
MADKILQQVSWTQALKGKRIRESDSDSEGEQTLTIAKTPREKPGKKKPRGNNPVKMPKGSPQSASAAPGTRLTTDRQEYVIPKRNVFRESQMNRAELPPSPPETPVAAPSSTNKSTETPVSSGAQWRRLGLYEFPLHEPEKISFPQYTWTVARQAVEIHQDASASLLLAEEIAHMQKETTEEFARMRKEFVESRQHQVDPDQEELKRKLGVAENALAIERHEKKDLQNKLAAERQAKKIFEDELTADRKAKVSLQNELTAEQKGKAYLQNELSLEQKSTKSLRENLATARQEKEDLSKARKKDASDYSTKLGELEKEKRDLSEKFSAEKKKCQDLENSNGVYNQQYQQFEEQKVQVKEQTVEQCKNHVLKGLVKLLADYWNDSSLTVDNIAPELHVAFFDVIDGNSNFDQLADHVNSYYNQFHWEPTNIEGSIEQGIVTDGTQRSASAVPQPPTLDWQQPAQANTPASQALVPVSQPVEMEVESTQVVTKTPVGTILPQMSIVNPNWTWSSPTQPSSVIGVGYATPESMEVDTTKPRRKVPCKYFSSDRGCNKWENCPFLHDEAVNRLGSAAPDPMEVEASKKKKISCRFIRSPGGCKQGAACMFRHPANSSTPQQAPSAGIGANTADRTEIETQIRKQLPECRYARRLGGCTRQNCPFTHPADPTVAQQSSATGLSTDTTDAMEVEVPNQRPLCKFMLHPGGCKKRDTCKSTHPDDFDCCFAPETVAILELEVLPAQRALFQAKSEEAKLQPIVQMVRGYYKFIDQMIGSARQASLNRKNRISFMKMMDGHIGAVGVLIHDAPPSLIRRFNLRANGFLAVGSSIDGWFDAGTNMPEDCIDSWMLLKMFDQVMVDKIQLPVHIASSPVSTSAPPAWNNEQSHDDSRGTTSLGALPISQLGQDLDAIIRSGAQNANHRRNRAPSRSSRSVQPYGRHRGTQPSHGDHFGDGNRLNLRAVNSGRIQRSTSPRQPPTGPRQQAYPGTTERNVYAQDRQQNAIRRTTFSQASERSAHPAAGLNKYPAPEDPPRIEAGRSKPGLRRTYKESTPGERT